jgi:hypothetical protein
MTEPHRVPEAGDRLTVVPYGAESPGWCWEVRQAIAARAATDLVIATDLPSGLEEQVLRAVKELPRISVLVDPLRRGIPIVPTSPPIEAVRSYLEYGVDLLFCDAGLPLCAEPAEVERFLELVRRHGLDRVVEAAEEFGVDIDAMIGLAGAPAPGVERPPFADSPALAGVTAYGPRLGAASAYFEGRQRFMASRLADPLREGRTVVFVCHALHAGPVRRFVEEGATLPPLSIPVPATCYRVRQADVPLVASEIPYLMYCYELFRDTPPDRRRWVRQLCGRAGEGAAEDDSVSEILALLEYAENLDLVAGRAGTPLETLVGASAACASPEYTERLFRLALTYPPADPETGVRIVPFVDHNLVPRTRPSFELLTTLREGRKRAAAFRRSRRPFRSTKFDRTPASLRSEREFMRFLSSTFVTQDATGEYSSTPFSCGLENGIDVRETVQHRADGSQRIYVRRREPSNDAAYVFYFGGDPTWSVYFDRQASMVGTAWREGDRFTMVSLVAFTRILPTGSIYHELDIGDPLGSALDVALKYARSVYLFTYDRADLAIRRPATGRVRWVDLASLPGSVRKKVLSYEVR